MERYSAETMNDLRLQAINLYADQDTLVPELEKPVVDDGTSDSQNAVTRV